jgi:hypothetical protein
MVNPAQLLFPDEPRTRDAGNGDFHDHNIQRRVKTRPIINN